MREKDLQKWQKCSSVAGNAGCWSGGGVTVEDATVSKPTCLSPAYDFRPQLKSHPAVIDVGLASGSGSITQRQDGGKAAECFQFMKWWWRGRREGGRGQSYLGLICGKLCSKWFKSALCSNVCLLTGTPELRDHWLSALLFPILQFAGHLKRVWALHLMFLLDLATLLPSYNYFY